MLQCRMVFIALRSKGTYSRGMDLQTIKRWLDGVACERERTTIPERFPALPESPGGRYWVTEFFALECEALGRRCWASFLF